MSQINTMPETVLSTFCILDSLILAILDGLGMVILLFFFSTDKLIYRETKNLGV